MLYRKGSGAGVGVSISGLDLDLDLGVRLDDILLVTVVAWCRDADLFGIDVAGNATGGLPLFGRSYFDLPLEVNISQERCRGAASRFWESLFVGLED